MGGVTLQYVFLVIDPLSLVLILVEDPQSFAFLNPFLLVVIVRCGIRYGIRTMWLVWSVAIVAAAALLPTSAYWRAETELTLTFVLILAFVPIFFPSLIRRVHNIRAIEEERARLGAMNEFIATRSNFLSKVSHELRSPLQSIVSALDVFEMRHGHGVVEDDELIGRMRRSSMLLNTQLRDLQTLAKGEAGHLQMQAEPFEVGTLVEGVATAVRDAALAKGLSLHVELPPTPTFVVADGSRIDQVLTNLVVNSVRYTHAGDVRVTLHPYDGATKHLHFTIADTGPGIPPQHLPHIFDRFYKADASRAGTHVPSGSGLGLSIVRAIVSRHGGEVRAANGPGGGAVFTITLPSAPR
jgi:signal transduction histidine kinase